MFTIIKTDKAFDPFKIGLFGSNTVVFAADNMPELIQ
jgi:hypothetical protein